MKKLRSVGSASNSQTELRCDCCDVQLREEDLITTFEGGFLFMTCVQCSLLQEYSDAHGQMSESDLLNTFFITPSNPSEEKEKHESK